MCNYRSILKILFIDVFRRREKKQIALFVALGVLYLTMMAGAVTMLALFAGGFAQVQAEFVTVILFGDFVMTIVLGLVASISFLYLSKDNEFFLQLPIKPQSVFMAKLTMVYLTEAVVSVGFLLPALITVGVVLNLPFLFFALIPLIVLTVPVFALIFIAVISMPIVYLITMFRNRGVVTTIIVITLFAAVMGLYLYLVMPKGASSDAVEIDVTPMFNLIRSLAYAFFPLYMLVKFAVLSPLYSWGLPLSMAIEILIFLACFVSAVALAYLVTHAFYNRVNSKVLERSAEKSKKRSHTQSSAFKSFFKKEFREVVRNPSVAFQALGGVVLCPLIVVMISLSMSSSFAGMEGVEKMVDALFWCMGIMMLLSVGIAGNAGANFCISREGENFYYLKILPAPYAVQIKAKQTLYVYCGMASTGVATVVLCATAAFKGIFIWWVPILLLASAFSWVYAIVSISIYMDLKSPRLDYKNIKEIVRRGKNSATALVWTFGSMIFSAAILICCVVFVEYYKAVLAAGLGVYAVTGLICALLFNKKLYGNAESLFEQLSV